MKIEKLPDIFYTVDKKGTLVFVDLLKVDYQTKIVEDIEDVKPYKDFGVKEIPLSRPRFNAKKKYLEKHGFEIRTVDGAEERLSKETVLEALNLHYPKEKMVEFTHSRAVVFDCYDIDLIKKIINKYLNGEMCDLLLNYWATFYSFCIEESYHVLPVSKARLLFMESITDSFKQFAIVLSPSMTQEEKRNKVASTLRAIENADALYHKQERLKKEAKKIQEEKKASLTDQENLKPEEKLTPEEKAIPEEPLEKDQVREDKESDLSNENQ